MIKPKYRSHRWLLWLLPIVVLSLATQQQEPIRYTQPASIPFAWDKLERTALTFTDSLGEEVLYRFSDQEDRPVYYARPIRTSVCFDDKCRLLDISLYWNITGRYLGFELPPGEFLSRQDHEAFTPADYERLNELLANEQLPFADLSFEALIRQSVPEQDSVDAVSGATSQEIKAYVVAGAAYTTYTMWRILYGATQDSVMLHTEQALQPELMQLLLNSEVAADRLWGLARLHRLAELSPTIEEQVLEMISGADYNLAYTAINGLQAQHLSTPRLQSGLVAAYPEVGYSLKKPLLQKLLEADTLSQDVIQQSWELLPDVTGDQLNVLLDLYRRHAARDVPTARAVAQLLEVNNSYITQKAYRYLAALEIDAPKLQQLLEAYRSKK